MLWGVVVGAAIIVAVAGIAKMARPAVAASAVRAVGPGVPDDAIIALGAGELVLGVVVVVWRNVPAAVVLGGLYVAFAVFSMLLVRARGSAASCGCFGQRDAPVGIEHIVVNLLVAATILAAAVTAAPDHVDPVAVVGAVALLLALLAIVPGLRSRS